MFAPLLKEIQGAISLSYKKKRNVWVGEHALFLAVYTYLVIACHSLSGLFVRNFHIH